MATEFKETSCSMLDIDDYAVFYSAERKWITKIQKLAETHPGMVKIVPHDDNTIDAYIPKSWFKIAPPKKVNLTEEQRAARAERMKMLRKT